MFANSEKLMKSIWHQFDFKVNNLQLEEYLIKENEILNTEESKKMTNYDIEVEWILFHWMKCNLHSLIPPWKNETFSYLRFSLF